jgi:hypothetical protein
MILSKGSQLFKPTIKHILRSERSLYSITILNKSYVGRHRRETKNRIQKNIDTKQRIENFKLKALKPFKKADKSHQIFDSNHKKKSLYFSKGIDPTLHTIDEKKVLQKLVPIEKPLVSNELSFC